MTEASTALESEKTTAAPKGVLLPIREALTSKRGISFSLTESLGSVGLWLLGAAVVGVGVGAAITFGQDSGAKGALDSVKSAQILQQSKTGKFGSKTDLTKSDATNKAALTSDPSKIDIWVSADGQNYCAVSTSASVFAPSYWLTAKDGKVSETKPTEAGTTCPAPVGSTATAP